MNAVEQEMDLENVIKEAEKIVERCQQMAMTEGTVAEQAFKISRALFGETYSTVPVTPIEFSLIDLPDEPEERGQEEEEYQVDSRSESVGAAELAAGFEETDVSYSVSSQDEEESEDPAGTSSSVASDEEIRASSDEAEDSDETGTEESEGEASSTREEVGDEAETSDQETVTNSGEQEEQVQAEDFQVQPRKKRLRRAAETVVYHANY